MSRLLFAIAVTVAAATAGASLGSARDEATFNCPKSATAKGTSLWVRNYAGYRGSTWCNDGATLTVSLKYPGHSESLSFPGGLCTKSRNGLHYQAGTHVSPDSSRKAKDPPGFILQKAGPKNLEDGISIGNSTWKWQESGVWDTTDPESTGVKITWSNGSLKGSFTGVDGEWVKDKYTLVKAVGSFKCKRIVNAVF